MQKFLLENGEGGIVFGPGFSAMKALCDEAKLLGMSDGGTIAEEILDSVRAQWKISDLGEFFSVFKQRSGCSVSFFTAYLKQREIAMSMLHHFCPAKALTTTDFVNFLGKKGIAANIKYNVDIAVLQEADISNYRAGSFKPIWVFFGLRGASEFCDEVQQVLTRLSEGDISDPLFIGGEYWLVRKNGVDVSLDEKEVLSKEALSKEMRDIWMGESVAKVLPKISCGVVKTVNVNTQGG